MDEENQQQDLGQQPLTFNWEGSPNQDRDQIRERYLIPEDTYEGTITGFGKLFVDQQYSKPGKPPKLRFALEITLDVTKELEDFLADAEDGSGKVPPKVPRFMAPSVVAPYGKNQGSTCFEYLEKSGDLEAMQAYITETQAGKPEGEKVTAQDLLVALEKAWINRRVKATITTANKGKEKEYSVVKDLPRFFPKGA